MLARRTRAEVQHATTATGIDRGPGWVWFVVSVNTVVQVAIVLVTIVYVSVVVRTTPVAVVITSHWVILEHLYFSCCLLLLVRFIALVSTQHVLY